tara:strand:- start:1292 stop:2140 length:849 start_codon:yes stop_codon:yes gene_type:complete
MNILTFDIEEWFHILDNDSTKTEADWLKYEVRIHKNMDKIFNFLIANNLKATFFVVGWIAKKYPEIVKKIDKLGFEIGSHSNMHQLLYELNKNDIYNDTKESILILENLIGKKISSYRAPGFSITEKNKWIFDILIELGITHDCSIFPANRSHGGFPSFGDALPSFISYNGLKIKEFPINTINIFGKPWIYSGGGYFRISPYFLIKNWSKKSDYIMTYFHPRDFDYNQPVIKDLTLIRKFKSYIGLKRSMSKLNNWINDFNFIDLKKADEMVDWENSKTIFL